ncbi:MAG TPA: thioredoxin family protein [Caldilineae bacterium]|nr:thioredoxin family protein [Caldilineae bacterium]
MIVVQLIGAPSCRRYQKMREIVVTEAERLNIPIRLEEIDGAARLAQYNPLSLPRLDIGGNLVASPNPPTPTAVAHHLQTHAQSS